MPIIIETRSNDIRTRTAPQDRTDIAIATIALEYQLYERSVLSQRLCPDDQSYISEKMRVLIIDGAAPDDADVKRLVEMVGQELQRMNVPFESVALREKNIAPCRGCYGCWIETPGQCHNQDDGPDIIRSWMVSDMVILVGNVTFGCYPSLLKNMLDRMIGILHPYYVAKRSSVEHLARYEFNPSLLAVGVRTELNEQNDETFKRLVHQNAITLNLFSARTSLICTEENESSKIDKLSSALAGMKVRK
ncbi:MAG TPA: NAD(P)H-dependent oxidoreductase [Methanomassiliicoccales archaeon]|nr:NAD(P)H-dependent oxidoreductase [Methanomassiliicoccales archaeon]